MTKPLNQGNKKQKITNYPAASEPLSLKTVKAVPNQLPIHWSTSVNALLDQPPATLPQRLIWGGLAFCLAFGTWAWFGTVEEVGQAQEKLTPSGTTYKIQPLELAKVSEIAVKEGDEVKQGQVLVELDSELAEKKIEPLQEALATLGRELVHKQALLEQLTKEAQTQATIATSEKQAQELALTLTKEKAANARQLLIQQEMEAAVYRNRKMGLPPLSNTPDEHLQQLQTQRLAHQQRLERLKLLEEEGAVSQEYYFQAEQALRETDEKLTQSQLQEITATNEQHFQAAQSLRTLEAQMLKNEGEIFAAESEAERFQAQLRQKQAQAQQRSLLPRDRTRAKLHQQKSGTHIF